MIVCLLILLFLSDSNCEKTAPNVDLVIPAAATGEAKYNEILKLGESPKYGSCWTEALQKLQTSCRSMREDQQQLLALSFTNCHLLMSGKSQLTCHTESDATECTSRMSDLAFQIYTDFFTHSENLCFFVQAQLWQQWQTKTVQSLANTAAEVVESLEETLEKQKSVETSVSKLHQSMTQDLPRILGSVDQLRSLVLGEYVWLHSIVFFVCSSLLMLVLTSNRRTRSARGWNGIILFVEFLLEVSLLRLGASNELIYVNQWRLRTVACGVVMLMWFCFFYSYRDINRENNRLLVELKHHILALQPPNVVSSNEEHERNRKWSHDGSVSPLKRADDSMYCLHCATEAKTIGGGGGAGGVVHLQYFMSEEEARAEDANSSMQLPVEEEELIDCEANEERGSSWDSSSFVSSIDGGGCDDNDDDPEEDDEDDEEERWSEMEDDVVTMTNNNSCTMESRYRTDREESEERCSDQTAPEHNDVPLTPRRSYNLRPRTPRLTPSNTPTLPSGAPRRRGHNNPILDEETAEEFAQSVSVQSRLVQQLYRQNKRT